MRICDSESRLQCSDLMLSFLLAGKEAQTAHAAGRETQKAHMDLQDAQAQAENCLEFCKVGSSPQLALAGQRVESLTHPG